VISGAGVVVIAVWMFTDEIETGRVRIILDKFEPKQLPIHARRAGSLQRR
jgi:hypothetical protein